MKTCKHPDGCTRAVKAQGWCRAHWERIIRNGEPGPVEIATHKMTGRECQVDGCRNPVGADGAREMCNKHYLRWRKHRSHEVVLTGGASLPGEVNPNWSGLDVGYKGAHNRVRSVRGKASDYTCIDCTNTAAHWSYNNCDPSERTDPRFGRYSADPDAYSPRCVPCHSAFDRVERALLTGVRPVYRIEEG